MYTYADESGNTGSNVLDPDQPFYYSGALMSQAALDEKYRAEFARYAAAQGHSHLHAGEMGMGKLVKLLARLERIIQKDRIRFFLGRMEKKWFVLAKFFDLVFDPHDNRGVAQLHYWVGPLRFLLLDHLHRIVRDEDLTEMWPALIAADFEASRTNLLKVMDRLLSRLGLLPDQRAREIIRDAFEWAIKHPEELGVNFQNKQLVLGHYPNVAMLTPLLGAVQRQAELWGTRAGIITHDQSSQFQSAWREVHKTLARAESVEFGLIGGPTHKIGIDKDSAFVIGDSKKIAGIQLIDVILWLWKRREAGAPMPPEANALLAKAFRSAQPYDMSHESTVRMAGEMLRPVMDSELTGKDLQRGRDLLAEMETQRRCRMSELDQSS